ncbi:carboxypeptidase N subunit 2-like [Branchiostoma lanceolatum]|uniref:carboxypeptidase N subunit 2-like n=1 Tax=Branchiostoma lanceolatum TaxID=7740 RepID=UPI003456EFB7
MASVGAVAVLVCGLVFIAAGAVRQSDCPRPCHCWKGTTQVYCNRLDLSSVPADLPTDVEVLDLRYNAITTVSRHDFAGLHSLRSVDLSLNQLMITGIHPGTFDDTPSLRTLDLSQNKNFNVFPPNLPSQVTHLFFVSNKVVHITADSLVNLTDLVFIDFSSNQVSIIDSDAFANQQKLEELHAESNNLTYIQPGALKPASALKTASFKYNNLTHVPLDLPVSLNNLAFTGNQIRHLPYKVFSNLTDLQTLVLFQQPSLVTISDGAFLGLGKLQVLDLTSTGIDRITRSTFAGLGGVWKLYLSRTRVSSLPVGAFQEMKNLTTLYLDGNLLTTLEPAVLDTRILPRLSNVVLSGNPWTCDCHLRWLKEHIDNNNTAPAIETPDIMTCEGPPRLKDRFWRTLTPDDFVC